MLIKKHRIISLSVLPGTSERKTSACVVENDDEFNLEQILKCGDKCRTFGVSDGNGEEIFEVKLSDKQVELLKERLKSKK